MIKILVITEDITEWVAKFTNCMELEVYRRTSRDVYLKNQIFVIYIQSFATEFMRGYRWNTIILDKPIDRRIEREILLPYLNWCTIKTDNYYEYANSSKE